MLCSVPTGKSGSNWLDRLRSSKGFPAAENLDLDHFLSNQRNSLSESPRTDPSNAVINSNSESTQSDNKLSIADRSQAADTSSGNGDKEWLGVMTNVLCDLFNMDEPNEKISRFSRKRSARKQSNPKFCDVSTPSIANDVESIRKDECVQAATATLHSDNNSNVRTNAHCGDDNVDDEEEKSSGGNGSSGGKMFKGYSRSEITVIDTSFEVWKFDKLVFRRKNIWKVLDKKGKSWTVGTKKRKGNHFESANGNVGFKKEVKSSISDFASSKDSHGGNFVSPVNDGMKQLDEIREEFYKDSPDDHSQIPKKRNHFSRSPRNSTKNDSSVVLIKAIPTSKKCGKNHPKNRLKESKS